MTTGTSEKPLIYVCGPYTTPDPVTNTRDACFTGNAILHAGGTPIVPHLSMLWQTISPKSYEEWMAYDFELLARCDALFRFKSPHPSAGADREVEFAEDLLIPVYDANKEPLAWTNLAAAIWARADGSGSL